MRLVHSQSFGCCGWCRRFNRAHHNVTRDVYVLSFLIESKEKALYTGDTKTALFFSSLRGQALESSYSVPTVPLWAFCWHLWPVGLCPFLKENIYNDKYQIYKTLTKNIFCNSLSEIFIFLRFLHAATDGISSERRVSSEGIVLVCMQLPHIDL